MGHLRETNLTYYEHLMRALDKCHSLFEAFVCLTIHAFIPQLFPHRASDIIKKLYVEKYKGCHADRILVRFNTKFQEDPDQRHWRVLVNGQETLAHRVEINVPAKTVMEQVGSEEKYHILCYGKVMTQHCECTEVVNGVQKVTNLYTSYVE